MPTTGTRQETEHKGFRQPAETREFPNGRAEILDIGDGEVECVTIGESSFARETLERVGAGQPRQTIRRRRKLPAASRQDLRLRAPAHPHGRRDRDGVRPGRRRHH
jgi:hypothetical protein